MLTCLGYVPDRGDAVQIVWNHKAGRNQLGFGMALVLSPAAYNEKVGFALFCPITDRVKGYPFEVPIPEYSKVSGVVLSDVVKSLDWRALKAELICRLPETTVAEVLRKSATLLSK
jgi:mRNA interferase MazF